MIHISPFNMNLIQRTVDLKEQAQSLSLNHLPSCHRMSSLSLQSCHQLRQLLHQHLCGASIRRACISISHLHRPISSVFHLPKVRVHRPGRSVVSLPSSPSRRPAMQNEVNGGRQTNFERERRRQGKTGRRKQALRARRARCIWT